MEWVFDGEIIEWRGPAPYFFVAMSESDSAELKEEARSLIYWGQVPVHVESRFNSPAPLLKPGVRSILERMRARVAIAAGVMVIASTSSCGADRVTIAPRVAPTPAPVIRSTPNCDGTVVTLPWTSFAAAFNAGRIDQAAGQFGGNHDFAWWDPTDEPSGGLQTLDELAAHLADLYELGVRLPETIYPRSPVGEAPGEGGFQFDDRQGFAGKGAIECQTAKIAYLVIDTWNPTIAGRAPIGEPFPPASP